MDHLVTLGQRVDGGCWEVLDLQFRDTAWDFHNWQHRFHSSCSRYQYWQRVLKAKEMGIDPGDISTLEE
jgi:hypothetical protein